MKCMKNEVCIFLQGQGFLEILNLVASFCKHRLFEMESMENVASNVRDGTSSCSFRSASCSPAVCAIAPFLYTPSTDDCRKTLVGMHCPQKHSSTYNP